MSELYATFCLCGGGGEGEFIFVFVYNCKKSLWKDTQETNMLSPGVGLRKGIGNRANECYRGKQDFSL